MSSVFGERFRAAFAPPRYLALPLSGIDLSTSGVKAVRLVLGAHGLMLAGYAAARLPVGAFADGEIIDRAAVVEALATAAAAAGISAANATLSESKAYLFETSAQGAHAAEWRIAIEQHLGELVPLPPPETVFDIVAVGQKESGEALLAGIGFARRIVDDTLSAFDQAGIGVRALEGEIFAIARALLPRGDESTTLIIDVGRTTTKLAIVAGCIPRFATTIGIGGHALTLAIQKHFTVTEDEARAIKAERGIVPGPGNEEYPATMLSTISAIRDEIVRRFEYWQEKATVGGAHQPVSQVILAGGSALIRGFPEYLEDALKVPVTTGNVFTNCAPRDARTPPLEYAESLAYATAIGCALRDHIQPYV